VKNGGHIRVGITGAEGFIGSNLRLRLRREPERFTPVVLSRTDFEDPADLAESVNRCDAVIHFAGESRNPDGEVLLRTNLRLTEALLTACRDSGCRPHIFLASTVHEARELPYHESKRRARAMIEEWARENGADCTTLRMPNTFGPQGRPGFNSVVSTFCFLAAQGREPERIDADAELKLIPVASLCGKIAEVLRDPEPGVGCLDIRHEYTIRLGALWELLSGWRKTLERGEFPVLSRRLEAELWSAFASYLS